MSCHHPIVVPIESHRTGLVKVCTSEIPHDCWLCDGDLPQDCFAHFKPVQNIPVLNPLIATASSAVQTTGNSSILALCSLGLMVLPFAKDHQMVFCFKHMRTPPSEQSESPLLCGFAASPTWWNFGFSRLLTALHDQCSQTRMLAVLLCDPKCCKAAQPLAV